MLTRVRTYKFKRYGLDAIVQAPGSTWTPGQEYKQNVTCTGRIDWGNTLSYFDIWMQHQPVVATAFKHLGKKASVIAGPHDNLYITIPKVITKRTKLVKEWGRRVQTAIVDKSTI
jgi:hypothetical protein